MALEIPIAVIAFGSVGASFIMLHRYIKTTTQWEKQKQQLEDEKNRLWTKEQEPYVIAEPKTKYDLKE